MIVREKPELLRNPRQRQHLRSLVLTQLNAADGLNMVEESPGQMIITGIDHVVLRVRDVDRSERFYTQVLGCAVEHRQDAIGLVHLRAGTSLIDLIAVDGALGRSGGPPAGVDGHNVDHICLRVSGFDIDSVRAHLEHHGVATGEVGVRYGSSGKAVSIYLKDPDGNGLELRA